MNLTASTKRKWRIVAWTTLYYLVGANLYSINRYWGMQGSFGEFTHDIIVANIGGLLGGCLMGIVHIFFLESRLRGSSWGRIILMEAVATLLVILCVFLPVTSLARALFIGKGTEEAFFYNYNYLFTMGFLSLTIYLLILSAVYNSTLLINKQFGRGIMAGLLTGKYLHPRQEERIFMFLDLKSSTTIAEKLGHIRYSQFLQKCFQDLADVALDSYAQIYQYVGDEAVLTWPTEEGMKDHRCIQLYFNFEKEIRKNAKYYEEKFGMIPIFTAGLHAGGVTVAEIGEYKREIAYHGDVVNTAARIQGMCGVLEHKFLASQSIAELIQENSPHSLTDLGSVQVKGRSKPVHLFSIKVKRVS